jgi:hypothetical protein
VQEGSFGKKNPTLIHPPSKCGRCVQHLELYNTGIMNLLDIPHFGCGKQINGCVKQLLERVHGGVLWMDRLVPINVDLITTIIGLPMDG